MSHIRAALHLGGTCGTPLEHNPELPAIPQAWGLFTAPARIRPAPESLCQQNGSPSPCVSCPDGHLVPVPCRATALSAQFEVPLLSPARGRPFGGLREALPGFGDGFKQPPPWHRWVRTLPRKSQPTEPGNPHQCPLVLLGTRDPRDPLMPVPRCTNPAGRLPSPASVPR